MAKVHKTLLAASRVCDAGNRIVLDNDGSYVEDKSDKYYFRCHNCDGRGHKSWECPSPIQTWDKTHVYRKNDVYTMKFKVKKPMQNTKAAKIVAEVEDDQESTSGKSRQGSIP